MPSLDVTDVLFDPDFATVMDVLRSTTATDPRGETVTTPTAFPSVSAVVTPANSNDLTRMADLERTGGAIAIHTTFRLSAGGNGATADLVTWQGQRYSVFQVDDWTQFGAGFVRATATMLDLS